MRICIINPYPFPEGMAATTRMVAYTKGLAQNGVDVEVVCFFPKDDVDQNPVCGEINGVKYSYINIRDKKRCKILRYLIERPIYIINTLSCIRKNKRDTYMGRVFSDCIFRVRTLNYRCLLTSKNGMKKRISMRKVLHESDRRLPDFTHTPVCDGMRDDFVPQGLVLLDDCYLISAYAGGKGEDHNSVIYVCDMKGEMLGVWQLPFSSHVGGLAFDGENLWVCSGGSRLMSFDLSKCFELMKVSEAACTDISSAAVEEVETDSRTSFCTYYEGMLWTGSFSDPPKYDCEAVSFAYKTDEREGSKLIARHSHEIPKRIQGMCFFKMDGRQYAALAKGGSTLLIYECEDYECPICSNNVIALKLPCMLEQIQERDGKLYMLFESSAKKYAKVFRRIVSRLCVVDLKHLLGKQEEHGHDKEGAC